ncbi:MAG: hypothetical protein PHE47_03765 [Oscillospiraceae bacterium]|nr:hypothetical protein [Oscillospiraceae bacterium]
MKSGKRNNRPLCKFATHKGSEDEKRPAYPLSGSAIPRDALTKDEFVVLISILKKTEHMQSPLSPAAVWRSGLLASFDRFQAPVIAIGFLKAKGRKFPALPAAPPQRLTPNLTTKPPLSTRKQGSKAKRSGFLQKCWTKGTATAALF